MASTRAAQRYARALMEIAKEENAFDLVVGDIRTIAGAIAGSHDLRYLLASPVIDDRTKERVIRAVFAGRIGTVMDRFISLLTLKGRAADLHEIVIAFDALLDLERKIVSAVVTVATEIGDDQKARIEAHVAEMSGQQIRAEYRIDPSIIGGFMARFGDTMVDASVRHQLERLRTAMIEGTNN